jgi:hypothetical protein
VSGTKSAEATEVLYLGKVQRVDRCRESGDLLYIALRRPFEGEGRHLYMLTLTVLGRGFFMRAASLPVWDCTPSSRVEEERERGSKP